MKGKILKTSFEKGRIAKGKGQKISSFSRPSPLAPRSSAHSGYIFIIFVLLAGALASMAVVSMLLLSWSQEQQADRQRASAQALELARSCMDIAVLQVREAPTGNINEQTIVLPRGSCSILASQGGGSDFRRICTQATSGNVTRYMTAIFDQRFPTPKISTFQEILSTSVCNTTH
jgi:type II secretory pathway pseudopilin PulG